MRCGPGRLSFDKSSMEQKRTDGHLVNQAVQRVKSTFSDFRAILANRSEGGLCIGAKRQIIKTDNADILRHTQPQLLTMKHYAVCQEVVVAQDGRYILLEQKRKMRLITLPSAL